MTDTLPPDTSKRLVVVSNRLPIVLSRDAEGGFRVEPGAGGLISALVPILRNRGGVWVGWPGTSDPEAVEFVRGLAGERRGFGYTLEPVVLTQEEEQGFYQGFSNEIIWPLFHDLLPHCNFDPAYWEYYQAVNDKFADRIAAIHQPGDFIWIHDYHLIGVASRLRARGIKAQVGFFLHIPFPPLDIFLRLPWRFEILRNLLAFDLLGFQTLRDRRNFMQCVRTLFERVGTEGKGQVMDLRVADRALCPPDSDQARCHAHLRIGAFPIAIDAAYFRERARSPEVDRLADYLESNLVGRKMILGVDRLDYTKGLPYKLEAFRYALRRYPELHNRVTLVQHVVPSRADIPEYQRLMREVEHLVTEINGEFTRSGWVPIHYIFRRLEPDELIAYYRTARMALITPLKDGMNLVAKEYCAANIKEDGVLILSEFAGAAPELQRAALLVNPYDIAGVARVIYEAFQMPLSERRARMRQLRRAVAQNDIFRWLDSYLNAAIAADLSAFPVIEDYIPHTDASG